MSTSHSTTKPEILTKIEAAKELRVSVRTIENWIKARRLAVIKAGRCVRIARTAIDAFKAAATINALT